MSELEGKIFFEDDKEVTVYPSGFNKTEIIRQHGIQFYIKLLIKNLDFTDIETELYCENCYNKTKVTLTDNNMCSCQSCGDSFEIEHNSFSVLVDSVAETIRRYDAYQQGYEYYQENESEDILHNYNYRKSVEKFLTYCLGLSWIATVVLGYFPLVQTKVWYGIAGLTATFAFLLILNYHKYEFKGNFREKAIQKGITESKREVGDLTEDQEETTTEEIEETTEVEETVTEDTIDQTVEKESVGDVVQEPKVENRSVEDIVQQTIQSLTNRTPKGQIEEYISQEIQDESPEETDELLDIEGINPRTKQKLEDIGVKTITQLAIQVRNGDPRVEDILYNSYYDNIIHQVQSQTEDLSKVEDIPRAKKVSDVEKTQNDTNTVNQTETNTGSNTTPNSEPESEAVVQESTTNTHTDDKELAGELEKEREEINEVLNILEKEDEIVSDEVETDRQTNSDEKENTTVESQNTQRSCRRYPTDMTETTHEINIEETSEKLTDIKGIGPKTKEKLNNKNIVTKAELRSKINTEEIQNILPNKYYSSIKEEIQIETKTEEEERDSLKPNYHRLF